MGLRLEALGWNQHFAAQFAPHAAAGLIAARVAVEHRNAYELLTGRGEAQAAQAGRLRHGAKGRLDLPAVGDWVALARPAPPARDGLGVIEAVLPRTSLFTRKAAGRSRAHRSSPPTSISSSSSPRSPPSSMRAVSSAISRWRGRVARPR